MRQEKMIQIRREKGKTQQELADYLGLSRSAVCLMELGLRRVTIDRAKKISDFLEEPISKIF